ncbi:MAG: succinate dehydrogenase, cytochrome b556 subunit [Proteobacteria bacterium]|nr:succinate dehydrogenase, cytochrome b556 subunit [Pseudomonadota bacterium]MBS0574249.1 succinate dehydrogenase, cytochrome b556 subunit [Pseudomonadota bacterium]
MADTTKHPDRHPRPLSPFMLGTYYRLQLTSFTSILTRITGNGLIVGTILIVWWMFAMTQGGAYYDLVNGIVHSWPGEVVLTLSLWAVWYHYLAGLRHLWFDAGRGLDLPTAEMLGWGLIVGSFLLTFLTFLVI